MEDAYEGALGAGTLKLVLYTKTRDLLWCAFVVARFCRFPTWTMTANLFINAGVSLVELEPGAFGTVTHLHERVGQNFSSFARALLHNSNCQGSRCMFLIHLWLC